MPLSPFQSVEHPAAPSAASTTAAAAAAGTSTSSLHLQPPLDNVNIIHNISQNLGNHENAPASQLAASPQGPPLRSKTPATLPPPQRSPRPIMSPADLPANDARGSQQPPPSTRPAASTPNNPGPSPFSFLDPPHQLLDDISEDYSADTISSPTASIALLVDAIERQLALPSPIQKPSLPSELFPSPLPSSSSSSPHSPASTSTITSPLSNPPDLGLDACILTCGCIVSEHQARSTFLASSPDLSRTSHNQIPSRPSKLTLLQNSSTFNPVTSASPTCPLCGSSPTSILRPLTQFGNIYKYVSAIKQILALSVLAPPNNPSKDLDDESNPNHLAMTSPDTPLNLNKPLPPSVNLESLLGMSLDEPTNVSLTNFSIKHGNKTTINKILLKRFQNATLNQYSKAKPSLLDIFRAATNTVDEFQRETKFLTEPPNVKPEHPEPSSTNTDYQLVSSTTTNSIPVPSFESFVTSDERDMYRLMTGSVGGIQLSKSVLQQRESFYSRCFPKYRKLFKHSINSRFPLARTKPYIATAITPDATRFVVVSETMWHVYKIPANYNEPPVLWLSGTTTGIITNHIEEKKYPKNSYSSQGSAASSSSSVFSSTVQIDPELLSKLYPLEKEDVRNWSHKLASLSNRYLAMSGTGGILRVYDIERGGKLVYHHKSKFNTKYLAISPKGNCIACATTGFNKKNPDQPVPMIVLHWLPSGDFCPQLVYYLTQSLSALPKNLVEAADPRLSFQKAETITIEVPYKDIINTLSFSDDESYIACSTRNTSHILIINITNHHQPRLVKPLSRSYNMDDAESEGTTSVQFHPGNHLISVTAACPKSYPVIIGTEIASQTNSQTQQTATFNALDQSAPQSSTFSETNINDTAPLYPTASGDPGSGASAIAPTLRTSSTASASGTGGAKFKVLMHVEKVGSRIYGCAVSPRVTRPRINSNSNNPPNNSSSALAGTSNNYNNVSAKAGGFGFFGGSVSGANVSVSSGGGASSATASTVWSNGFGNNIMTNTSSSGEGLSNSVGGTNTPAGLPILTSVSSYPGNSTPAGSDSGFSSLSPPSSFPMATGSALGQSISVAYLDRNGLVYLMHTQDRVHKCIVVLTEMASAPTFMEAASLRFTSTGHALFSLDRKGNFHIQDFAAGYPQQAGISKCRILA